MTWIFAYSGGSWHLTEHIPVVSTSCFKTMHTILAYTRSIPKLKFQHYDTFRPRSFTLTMVYGTPHKVPINLLYKPKATPLHRHCFFLNPTCDLWSLYRSEPGFTKFRFQGMTQYPEKSDQWDAR